jgi:tetratricopeptide (TPR) repeat protein
MWSNLRQKAGLVPGALDLAYRTTIKILVVAFGVVVVVATVHAMWADQIVIEPLSVPRKFEDDGYSGAIVSQRLLREVRVIGESVDTLLREPTGNAVERVSFRNDDALAPLAAIQVPASGLSLRSVSAVLRDFLGIPERKITGEITIKRPAGTTGAAVYSVVLQLPSAGSLSIEHADIDKAINLSAQAIAEQYDPLGLAAYYFKEDKKEMWGRKESREKWEKMDRITDALIESEGSKLKKEGLFLRGLFLHQIAQLPDAIYFFEQAIKENHSFSDAYNGWAAVLVDEKRIGEALEIYREAIELSPGNAETFRNRAIAHKRRQEHELAIADFKEAIKLGLKDVDVYFELGRSYEAVGDFARAIEAYDQAIRLQPRHAWALNNRCYNKAILGQVSAIVDCNAALRLMRTPAVYDSRGFAYLKLNQLDEAIADYDTALKLYPAGSEDKDQAFSFFGRGVAKLRKGDVAGGVADIDTAKKIRPDMPQEMAKMGVQL